MSSGSTTHNPVFITDSGIEVPSVTETQMREVDRIAVEETGPNLYQMMENAGRNLALRAIDMLGDNWSSSSIVVLAGTGGNGGGGICAGRHLANRGAQVKLCVSDIDRLREVPAYQYKVYQNSGAAEVRLTELDKEAPDLIIDAIIGYSLKSAPRGAAVHMINWANGSESPVLSLDIPSGVDSTSGESPGEFIHADSTLTLALPKTGLLPEVTGELFLSDIGIPSGAYEKLGLSYVSPFGGRYVVPIQKI